MAMGEFMNGSRAYFVATVAAISVVMITSQGWAAKAGGGRDAAVSKCIAQVQAQFGGPANSPDCNQQQRLALYKSCMTSAGYRP